MSIDRRNIEGGITHISAWLPPHIEEGTGEAIDAIEELDAALGAIATSPVASVEYDGDQPYLVGIAPHTTQADLEEVIRTIGRHVGEDGVDALHANLPLALGIISLNVFEWATITDARDRLREVAERRVSESLDILRSAIDPKGKGVAIEHEIWLGRDKLLGDPDPATIEFTVGLSSYTASIDKVVRVAEITADHIESAGAQPAAPNYQSLSRRRLQPERRGE